MPIRATSDAPPLNLPAYQLTTGYYAFTTKDTWVKAISFYNSDSADRTVTVADGSGFVYLSDTVAAGKSVDWTIERFFKGGVKALASVGGKVNAFPYCTLIQY